MYYYIDGYNLLFRFIDSKHPLKKQRESVIQFLRKEFAHLKIDGLLVFDGKHRLDEESGRAYPSPLEIAYAPKGQTADHYILEKLEFDKRPITVVTDDQTLSRAVRALGAKTLSNASFLEWLGKKKKKKKEKKVIEPVESSYQIDRLLKIFENKLKEEK